MSDTPRTAIESDMPIELVAARLWSGTKWHYPNIERMVEENKRLRADLAQRTAEVAKANAERDEARREVCVSEARYADERDNSDDLYCASEESIMRAARRISLERGWNCFDAPHTNTPDVPVRNGGEP